MENDIIYGIWKFAMLLSSFFLFYMFGRMCEQKGIYMRDIFKKNL